jgi:sarcosine oxidase subunit gamma
MTAGRSGNPQGAPGLCVRRHRTALVASVIAQRGAAVALTAAARELFGAALPSTPRWIEAANANLIWNGPGHWLIESGDGSVTPAQLIGALATHAAIVDQTDSRILLDVSGPKVRDTLAKGLPIDLHHGRFQVGDVALTSASHVGVQIWQTHPDPVYRLAVARSYFGSFWHWLAASAAEYGCEVSAPP